MKPILSDFYFPWTAFANFSIYLKTLSNEFFSSISLTIDEPTTTPSAISATFFASSGVFIPKPTQIGIFVWFLIVFTCSSTFLISRFFDPVIPVTET